MQAVMYQRFGDESVLSIREIAVPIPARGQVQVKVRVASLNPVDFKLRSGMLRMLGRPKRPAITGKDFAGTITAVGPQVEAYAVGQRVFGSVDPLGGNGSCAEYVCLATDLITATPDNVSDEVAACLPVASGTALEVLSDIAHLRQRQTILITGASGAVGASAVQLARSIGAHVTGVCSTTNVDYVLSLGADHVIDYKIARWQSIDSRFDVIFDAAASATFASARAHLAVDGVYINTMPRGALFVAALMARLTSRQRCVPYLLKTTPELLGRLADLAAGKVIVPRIGAVIDLSQVAEAQGRMQRGEAHGKICVRIEA